MKTTTLDPQPRTRYLDARPLRLRAELPTAVLPTRPFLPAATHDFLVPNPRPDLTVDPRTLRMMEAR